MTLTPKATVHMARIRLLNNIVTPQEFTADLGETSYTCDLGHVGAISGDRLTFS
ncbi:MAG: hypothetical protein LBL92_06660 [Propionibacteriaceae bacterium]|nr:hypothetical protein [Propionibacteriaceae bacterium]